MTIKCERLDSNAKLCNCSYEPCPRKGNCCACIHYHLENKQLPACAFPDDVEKGFDRSFANFVKVCREKYNIK